MSFLISDFESKSFPTTAYHAQKALRFKQITTLNIFYHLEFGKVFQTALKGKSLEDFKLKKNYEIRKTVHAGYAEGSY